MKVPIARQHTFSLIIASHKEGKCPLAMERKVFIWLPADGPS